MGLALVLAQYEGELICDLAQYYHILNYRDLSPVLVATFLIGLPNDSRVKMALSGQKISMETAIMARIADDIAFLAWAQSQDGQKNRNRPKSILKTLLGEDKKPEEYESFRTPAEFDKRWKELTGR